MTTYLELYIAIGLLIVVLGTVVEARWALTFWRTLREILVRTWRIVTLQRREALESRRHRESLAAYQARRDGARYLREDQPGDPMDVWWREDLAVTESAIDRIQRELNRVEWERQTIQGERAADLLPPLEVPTEGNLLNMVIAQAPEIPTMRIRAPL
jgi:hypothetical protein